jgi:predicted Zn-dependent peptidase
MPTLEFSDFTLDNGLRVVLLEDHAIPQVVVNTWFGVGSYDDPEGASGFAHLFEHLMFKGTEGVPMGIYDSTLEGAGGSNNASTSDDRTDYYEWGPSNLLELMLFLESDRMTGLAVTQEKLDLEREVVRNERRQNYEDRPYGGIWWELPQMLYPESHRYHRPGIGSHEELMAATTEHVSGFYQDWYRPNNATLVVAGDFDPAAAEALIRELYGSLERTELPDHAAWEQPTAPVDARRTITDRIPAPAVVLSWHSPPLFADGDADMDIAADLLAGSDDARLTRRLVYDEELAQEVYAFQSSSSRGSQFTVMVFGGPDADPETWQASIEDAVYEELAVFSGAAPATDDELLVSLRGWEMSFLYGMESLRGRAGRVQSYLDHLGRPDGVAEDLARYSEVTADSLRAAVSQWLTPDAAAVLSVVPESASPDAGGAE